MPWSAWARCTAASPVMASTRRVPAEMPCSAVTRKRPISPVWWTWVPPQNSLEKPGTSTIRTSSPYLSPKKARAPSASAFSRPITRVLRAVPFRISEFTRFSRWRSSRGFTAV